MRACFALLLSLIATVPAGAACVDDLVKADQNFNRTRSELLKVASAVPATKCAAYRKHVASLNEVRRVFGRCDTSSAKAQNAARVNADIAEFSKQTQLNCKK